MDDNDITSQKNCKSHKALSMKEPLSAMTDPSSAFQTLSEALGGFNNSVHLAMKDPYDGVFQPYKNRQKLIDDLFKPSNDLFSRLDQSNNQFSEILKHTEPFRESLNIASMTGISSGLPFKETLDQLGLTKKSPSNAIASSVLNAKVYEWGDDDDLVEVPAARAEFHPEYEHIKGNIYPRMTIEDLAILHSPKNEANRYQFRAKLIRLVASNYLINCGISPLADFATTQNKPKYWLILIDDYLKCGQLEVRGEDRIDEWFESSPQSLLPPPKPLPKLGESFVYDENLSISLNRLKALFLYCEREGYANNHKFKLTKIKLWLLLSKEEFKNKWGQNLFKNSSQHTVVEFFKDHAPVSFIRGRPLV